MLVEYISYGLMESLSVFTRLPLGLPGRSGGSCTSVGLCSSYMCYYLERTLFAHSLRDYTFPLISSIFSMVALYYIEQNPSVVFPPLPRGTASTR